MLSGGIRTMMVGAGLGLVTSSFILTLANTYISRSLGAMGGAGDIYALLGLSGCDKALSIVLGALVARVTISSMRLSIAPK
jgi:hypothetical protein